MFFLEVDLSSLSGLLQYPLGYEGRFFLIEIGIEGSLSPILAMGLLLLYDQTIGS
jgi:hypothetical protein